MKKLLLFEARSVQAKLQGSHPLATSTKRRVILKAGRFTLKALYYEWLKQGLPDADLAKKQREEDVRIGLAAVLSQKICKI